MSLAQTVTCSQCYHLLVPSCHACHHVLWSNAAEPCMLPADEGAEEDDDDDDDVDSDNDLGVGFSMAAPDQEEADGFDWDVVRAMQSSLISASNQRSKNSSHIATASMSHSAHGNVWDLTCPLPSWCNLSPELGHNQAGASAFLKKPAATEQ